MAGGETNIGGIVGFLRLEADEFHREIQQAILEVESLQGKDVSVGVKTNAGALDRLPATARAASKSVDDLAASERRLEDATKRVNIAQLKLSELNESGKAKASQLMTAQLNLTRAQRDEADAAKVLEGVKGRVATASEKAATAAEREAKAHKESAKEAQNNGQQMGLLATAIMTLGPALVPLAAGAAGLAGGFATMGAAGLLAFKGIAAEMKAGTAVGEAYTRGVNTLKDDLGKLEHVAAGNVLGSFQTTVGNLQTQMPQLTHMVDEFSTMTGKAAGAIATGLVTGLTKLEPMLQTAGVYVVELAQHFQDMMSGDGITKFGSYVESVLPQVEQTLSALTGAVSNLIQSFAPLGGATLTAVSALAQGIADINPDILTGLSTTVGAVAVGFKAWQGLSGLVSGVGGAMQFLGFSADTAATAVRALTLATGVVGVALTALTVGFTLVAEHNQNMQQATDDYTAALEKSNGAMDDSVRIAALKHAQDDGTIKDAAELGLSTNDLVDAYLNLPGAMDKVKAAYEAHHIALTSQKGELADTANKVDHLDSTYGHLVSQVGDSTTQINDAKVAWQQKKDVLDAAAGSTQGLDEANQRMADHMGVSLDVFDQVAASQQKIADKADAARQKMKDEDDAAGLLKQALDELNGKALSNSEAQDAYAKSRNSLGSQTQQAQDALNALYKQRDGLTGGHVSPGASGAVDSATLAHNQAVEKYNALQANPKATAMQLLAARQKVESTNQRLGAAEAKLGKLTGGATQAQWDSVNASIAAAKAKLDESKAVDGNSDAALANRDKIRAMMEAGNKAAGTSADLAASNKDARDKLIQVREDIVKTGAKWGWNADQIRHYLDEVDQVPAYIEPTKTDVLTAPSIQKIHEFVGVINGVPTWKDVEVKVKDDGAEALAALANVQEAIAGVQDKTITISAVYQQFGQQAALQAHNATQLDAHHINANGSIRMNGVRMMAEGGFAGRESTIMRSTSPILWNEAPGGEAYISLAPQKRARSLAIYGEVGRMLGVGGGGGGRMHPDDIGALARALGREIRSMPTPEVSVARLDNAFGGY